MAKILSEDGLGFVVDLALAGKCEVLVNTIDGSWPNAYSSGCVKITNPEGDCIEMIGL